MEKSEIKGSFGFFGFPASLEKAYLRHYAATRLITSTRLIAAGLLVYLLFIALDFIAFSREAALLTSLLRLLTFLVVAGALVIAHYIKGRVGFLTVFLLALLINTSVVAIDVIGSRSAGHKLVLGSLFVMVASFTLVRFPFWISGALISVMFATQLAAMLFFMKLTAQELLNNVLFYSFIILLLLVSNHSTDVDSRRLFLLTHYRKKYERSGLDALTLSNIAARLDVCMQQQKAYLNPELTIDDVATILNVRRHHLTQTISEVHGTNFLSFVNGFRVDEARRLLEGSDQDMTVLRIAFDTGFNSKATFNRIFRRATGLSPSEYRQKNRKNP